MRGDSRRPRQCRVTVFRASIARKAKTHAVLTGRTQVVDVTGEHGDFAAPPGGLVEPEQCRCAAVHLGVGLVRGKEVAGEVGVERERVVSGLSDSGAHVSERP